MSVWDDSLENAPGGDPVPSIKREYHHSTIDEPLMS